MPQDCAGRLPLLDALLDGELPPDRAADVAAHAKLCTLCGTELADRRRLKEAVARLQLPDVPARRRTGRWVAAAAAAFIAVAGVFLLPPRVPEVVALSSRLHDRYLEGSLTPRELGLKVSIPGADFVGRCDCPPALGNSVPLVAYRKGATPITLLILEVEPGLPASSRRESPFPYWFFKSGRNRVMVCPKGTLTQIWISRLPEDELLGAVLTTRVGRTLADSTRVTLGELSCLACCSILESRVRGVEGVKDAAVDIVAMELVVSSEGGKPDLDKILGGIRQACSHGKK